MLFAPSKDRGSVTAAIGRLQLCEATATGEAVFASLAAIAAVPPDGATGPPPARLLLLSDGYRTAGRSIEDAAQAAAAANVRVSTIAFGTDHGIIDMGGEPQLLGADRQALTSLAEVTRGQFYETASRDDLRHVYQDLGSSIGYRTVPRDVWPWSVAAGLLFALTAAGLSLLWTSRMP